MSRLVVEIDPTPLKKNERVLFWKISYCIEAIVVEILPLSGAAATLSVAVPSEEDATWAKLTMDTPIRPDKSGAKGEADLFSAIKGAAKIKMVIIR